MKRALAFIEPAPTPVTYVRFFQPFDHLRDLGWEMRTLGASIDAIRRPDGLRLDPALLDGVDLVIFPQNVVPLDFVNTGDAVGLVERFCADAKARGAAIVYSPDDAILDTDPRNPTYDMVKLSFPSVRAVIAAADAFFVTTQRLADAIETTGRPVYVLQNAIDPRLWPVRPRRSGEWRVGWSGGGGGHAPDLLLALPALEALRRRQPVRFFVQGFSNSPLRETAREIEAQLPGASAPFREAGERVIELARRLEELGAVHAPFCPFAELFRRLPALDLDIGLCPLEDTPFNRCKSANKFSEYAVTGSLTLASDVPPYAGEVSTALPNDPAVWADALEFWLRRREEREAEALRQREFVLRERNIETMRFRWAAALEAVAASRRRADVG